MLASCLANDPIPTKSAIGLVARRMMEGKYRPVSCFIESRRTSFEIDRQFFRKKSFPIRRRYNAAVGVHKKHPSALTILW